jgi:hypothetical protein
MYTHSEMKVSGTQEADPKTNELVDRRSDQHR